MPYDCSIFDHQFIINVTLINIYIDYSSKTEVETASFLFTKVNPLITKHTTTLTSPYDNAL